MKMLPYLWSIESIPAKDHIDMRDILVGKLGEPTGDPEYPDWDEWPVGDALLLLRRSGFHQPFTKQYVVRFLYTGANSMQYTPIVRWVYDDAGRLIDKLYGTEQ